MKMLEDDRESDTIDFRSLHYVLLNENLVCPICCSAFIDPCDTKCGHTFCSQCLHRALTLSAKCPVDRSALNQEDVYPSPKIISNMVNELLVHCPHSEEGCESVVERSLLAFHLKERCLFSMVECPLDQCTERIQRRFLLLDPAKCFHEKVKCSYCDESIKVYEQESHLDVCKTRTTKCTNCMKEMPVAEVKEHQDECPEATINCFCKDYGCEWSGIRQKLEAHTSSCIFQKFRPFMMTMEEKMSKLEIENKSLKNKMNDMQSIGTIYNNSSSPMFDPDALHILAEHNRLRSELERLSEQLGEMEIRQSVMLMNESVRTKNEIQAIRSAVNGIRHQIHFLLMDRRTWALQQSPLIPQNLVSHNSTAREEIGDDNHGSVASVASSALGSREGEVYRQDVKL
ncbi:hypothetical protein V1511DRAFT_493226 [Dipodascopsis uninucleata]